MKSFQLTALLLCVLLVSQAQNQRQSFFADSLDSYIQNGLKEWQIPGASVCIVKDGHVVLMKGYGIKELNKADSVNQNTSFSIGSNTKAFIGASFAILQDRKVLSIDDKVIKWIPEFKVYDPWVAQNATIKDLLSHRLGYETFQGDFMFFSSDLTSQEIIKKLSLLVPKYNFRDQWHYSNAGYLLAGEIIYRATGKKWNEFVMENIFLPLEMNETVCLNAGIPGIKNKAFPHKIVENHLIEVPFLNIDHIGPAGSISSTANDISHWMLMQLDKGKYKNKQVINENALLQTRSPYSIIANDNSDLNSGHFDLYGLGWGIHEYKGRVLLGHTGGVVGFLSSITLLPKENLGIAIFTNTDANEFYQELEKVIVDAYLNLPFINHSKNALAEVEQNRTSRRKWLKRMSDSASLNLKPKLSISAYTGNYNSDVYGNISISASPNTLLIKFQHHSKLIATLQSLGGTRFYCTYSDPEFGRKILEFKIKNHRIYSLELIVAGHVETTTYNFIKK